MGCNCGGRRGPAKPKRGRVVPPPDAAADIARGAAGGSPRRPSRPVRPPQVAPRIAPPAQPQRPQPQARPRVAAPGSARAAAYTVLRGDTIAGIALRFGMTAKELVRYDGGTGVPNIMRLRSRNAHVVHPGEVILVPRRAG